MRCPNCQQDNPDTNSFCSKCASSLAKQHAREVSRTKIFIPPQHQFDSNVNRSQKSSNSSGGLVVVITLIIIVSSLIVLYLYG